MNDKRLYILWGIAFLVCALLGAVPEPDGLMKALLVLLAVLFFVPGTILMHRAVGRRDRKSVLRICGICALSLILTLIAIVANVLSVNLSESAGNILYGILIVVSSPMVCGQYWFLSLFLWACLMFAGLTHLPKKQ